MPYHATETRHLAELQETLRQVEEWPEDCPLSFVIHLAPRTRGRLGELLIDRIAADHGLTSASSRTPDFDRLISCSDGSAIKLEAKFSTENPPRFQQVRDPRLEGTVLKYDYLVCISGRPEGLVYWAIPGLQVAELMDDGLMVVQHAMSDTKWFFPSRTETDPYVEFRMDYAQLSDWISRLCP
jgi:hypothetical protein